MGHKKTEAGLGFLLYFVWQLLSFCRITSIARRACAGGAHEDFAAIFKGYVATICSLRSIFRLVPIYNDNRARQ